MNYEVEVLPVAIGAVVLTIATLIIGLGIIMMKRVNESIKRASDAIDEEERVAGGLAERTAGGEGPFRFRRNGFRRS